MGKAANLSGVVFERLTALRRVERVSNHAHWLCLCVCGSEKIVSATNLKTGHTRSCGCMPSKPAPPRENKSTAMPGYSSWAAMINRCTDPKHDNYAHYSSAGITVCAEWLSDFQAFISHIGPKPTSKHSVDRIDNAKGYEPGNVRWATSIEQAANRKNTAMVVYQGVSQPLSLLARSHGLCPMLVNKRVVRRGWSVEKALGLST